MIATSTDASLNSSSVECSVCVNWCWSFSNSSIQKKDSDELDASTHDVSFLQVVLPQSDVAIDVQTKFDWEETFFKKFEWLQEASNNSVSFLHLDVSNSNILVDSSLNLYSNLTSNLYFISLDNECMFLHYCEKENDQDIMNKCLLKYEYVKINRPHKIVFTLKNIESYEVDEIVELFMCQFGIDKTRGGSYTDVELSDEIRKILAIKFKMMNLDSRI